MCGYKKGYTGCYYCDKTFKHESKGLVLPKFCSEKCKEAYKLLKETPEQKRVKELKGIIKKGVSHNTVDLLKEIERIWP